MARPGSYTTLVSGRGEAEPPARQLHRLSERVPECSRSHSLPLARYGSGMAGAAGTLRGLLAERGFFEGDLGFLEVGRGAPHIEGPPGFWAGAPAPAGGRGPRASVNVR